jgi:hypothetical protein
LVIPSGQKIHSKPGFRKVGDVVEHQENDALLGMLDKVSHLVEIETVDEEK